MPRLQIDETALLVIDLQERLMPTFVDAHQVLTNAAVLLRMADVLQIPYLVTEQNPAGLGRTAEEVTAAMPDQSLRVEKTQFSALVDVVDSRLTGWRRPSVLICGVEAHVCVLQTVLDLQASGRQAYVCTDAISSSQREQLQPAVSRMTRAGAVMTGVLSAMYELLGDSRHPAFRECLSLAKSIEH